MPSAKYQRVLLKISGEALVGSQSFGIDSDTAEWIARDIAEVQQLGVQVAVVIGGGIIFRGLAASAQGMDRATADYMGMLATVINGLALSDAIERYGVETRVVTAIEMREVAEPFIRRRAIRHLEKGRVVVFGAGTGNPYFSTDTAAALRATELKAQILLKATKVNGVFDKDPETNKDAKHFKKISYSDILSKNLRIMDMTAITLCKENNLPIRVFDVNGKGNLKEILSGQEIGSMVSN